MITWFLCYACATCMSKYGSSKGTDFIEMKVNWVTGLILWSKIKDD